MSDSSSSITASNELLVWAQICTNLNHAWPQNHRAFQTVRVCVDFDVCEIISAQNLKSFHHELLFVY